MMEKLAQAGEGQGARPPPFTIFTITNKVAVYAPAERADTLPLFLPYVLCGPANICLPFQEIHTLFLGSVNDTYQVNFIRFSKMN
jgi:hypothetical protein